MPARPAYGVTIARRDRAPVAAARSALISMGWNYAGSVVAIFLQLGYTAYTGRRVAPGAFGAYAIALTVIQLLGYFANAGLSTYVLRSEQLTRPAVRAARRLGTLSGLACCLLAEAAAPVFGALWQVPDLTEILRVLGCQFLVQPAASVTVTALRRVGRARAAVVAELTGQAAGIAAGTALLAHGCNPLGLAAAQPVAAAVILVISTAGIAGRPLAPGPHVRMRDLLAPSGFLMGYSLGEFAANSTPMWVAGRLFGPAAAGAYSRAALLTGLPLTPLFQGMNWAVTPLLADRRRRGLPLGSAVQHTVYTASATAFLGSGVMSGVGPAALLLLLGPGWGAAASLVPVLAAASALTMICSSGISIDQARRAPRALVATQIAVMTTTVAGAAVAVTADKLLLLAGAAVAGQAAGHLVQLTCWHRCGLLRVGVALHAHTVHAAVGAALGAAGALGAWGRPPAAAVAYGLSFMLPVVLVCTLLRSRIPLYSAVVATRRHQPADDRRTAVGPSVADGLTTASQPGTTEGHGPCTSASPAP